MDFLQITNAFLDESGLSDPLSSIDELSATDETIKAVRWVREAWLEIQRSRLWSFRWSEGFIDTNLDRAEYALADVGLALDTVILEDTVKIKDSYGAYIPLTWTAYKTVRMNHRESPSSGVPSQIAQKPNGGLILYPTPDAIYELVFDMYLAPTPLVLSSDVPALPTAYQYAIVWKALENYSRDEGNEWKGLYQSSIRNYNAVYSQMLSLFLPKVERGGTLLT